MRIYLTGPRRGDSFQFDPGLRTASVLRLRAMGHEVAMPASWEHETFRQDITQLLDCEAVALLPGWLHSEAAQIEVQLAEKLGMSCRPLNAFLLAEEDGPDELPPLAILQETTRGVDDSASRPTGGVA